MRTKNYLQLLDTKTFKTVKDIGEFADKQNIKAYIVGGIVRDLILNIPNDDLDVVLETDAVAFAQEYAGQLNKKIITHPSFRTATVWMDAKTHIDFVSARREDYKKPGALPTVYASDLKDDLFRRDFTVNALAICINKGSFGKLIDLYNGMKDIQEKRIRVLHDQSFVDDPTRILRAIRFEQRLGFRIEAKTLRQLKLALEQKCEKTVTPGRYFREFTKMLKEKDPIKCFKRLNGLNAWGFFKEDFACDLKNLKGVEKSMNGKKAVKEDDKSMIYLSALFRQMSLARRRELGVRFQIPKKSRIELESGVLLKGVANG